MMIPVLHDWIKNLIIRSEIFMLYGIKSEENVLVDLVNGGFNELKCLIISDCEEMKYLFNTLERTPRVTFRRLEMLLINSNRNLLEICHGQLPDRYFCNVNCLEVEHCGKVLNVLPSHLLKSFQNLEHLEVSDCESLVYVFECEGIEIVEEETELCSSLKELELRYLPRMTHIWKGDAQFASLHNLKRVDLSDCEELGGALFPATLVQSLIHLEEVSVSLCSKLDEIFGRKAEEGHENELKRRGQIHATLSSALENLVKVSIYDCRELRSLFTTSMAKSLMQLQILKLERCPTLKEIITATEKVRASTKRITFPSLAHMELYGLDSLSCFSSGLYDIEFPALEDLTIRECPSMETFCRGQMQVMTPKLKRLRFDNEEYRCTGNLNDAVKHIFSQKNHHIHEEH